MTAFEGAGWSAQGRGTLAGWLSPFGVRSPLRLELGGEVGGSRYSRGFDTVTGRLDGRLHLVGRRAGAWVGVSAAAARNAYDSTTVTSLLPGVGVWLQNRSVRGMVAYQHPRISGESYPEASLSLTTSLGPVDVSAWAGARDWPYDAGVIDETWAGGAATLWLSSRAALIVSGGSYASDVLQGLPGGDFISFGLRLTPRRSRPLPVDVTAPIVYSVEEAREGTIGFTIEDAGSVEIAGDWNGWRPTPLTRDREGRWVLPAGLAPGAYRFNLLVDGERWMVPDGVPTIQDGFGGTVGLLIVSESDGGL